MLKDECNSCSNMVLFHRSRISIPTLDTQSQDGFYAVSTLNVDAPFQDGFLLKTSLKKSRLDTYNV